MKKVLILLLLLPALQGFAQNINEGDPGIGKIKLSMGYAYDFPGLGGTGLSGEFSHTFLYSWEGSIGMKYFHITGHPRTATVEEYTKATTIDLNLFYLPFQTETQTLRVGVGYAYSFYNIRRSYPHIETSGNEKVTHWPVQDQKGWASGFSLIGEYEYRIPQTRFSLGMRAAWYQAYDRVTYIGPFAGIAF